MFYSCIIRTFALMMTISDIANNIKRIIKDRELTLEKVAEQMNVSSSAMSHLLKDGANPSVGKLIELAEILDVPVSDFFQRNDNGAGKGANHTSGTFLTDAPNVQTLEPPVLESSSINSLLKAAIQARGMTIGSVAAKMRNERGGYTGVSQQSLSTMLRGRIAFERVEEICGILGMSVAELLANGCSPARSNSKPSDFVAFVRSDGTTYTADSVEQLESVIRSIKGVKE